MPELLIAIRDRSEHWQDIKAGQVIVICQDGWHWTRAEREHPDWRIVRAPLVQTEIDALQQPLIRNPGTAFEALEARRTHVVRIRDVASLDASSRRTRDRDEVLEVSKAELVAAVEQRAIGLSRR